ncbi:MAG TPA: prolyl oligopeptidase family serine peptidase [Blastocatellia bacterium]|nr:prolyl oligopeptidase family serine peptidase [Blastocatellia bacterium]
MIMGKYRSTCYIRLTTHLGLLLICALILALPNPAFTQQARKAQPAESKRPLTHQDYDGWRSIQGSQLSRDGKFVAYAVLPQDGDGEIVVRNLTTGVEWRQGRGWRQPLPVPDFAEAGAAQNYANQQSQLVRPSFTSDNRFLIFPIEPKKAEVLKARKEKKKSEEMPKNALGIMDLANGQVTRLERVKNYQVPEDASGYLAYLLEPKLPAPEEKKDEKKPDAATSGQSAPGRAGRDKKKEYGSELVLRNLANNSERSFGDALEYTLSKDAMSLIYQVSSKKEETNGIYWFTPGSEMPPVELLSGKGRYHKLTWDEEQKQLAFISDRDEAGTDQPKFKLYQWTRLAPKAVEIVSSGTPNFPRELTINEKTSLNFSRDGEHLFFNLSSPPEPEKDPEAESGNDEKVIVDLWHWKDDFIQPMQKVRAEQDRNRSYPAAYHFKEKRFVQLGDETMQSVSQSVNGLWAIGTDDREYRIAVGWESFGGVTDVYLVNTLDGKRKELLKKQRSAVSISPNGKYALYYDGKDWNTISIPEGKVTNLTRKLGVNFWQEDNDVPNTPPSYGSAGWVKDERYVLLYDQYDIWQIAPDGSSSKNLTEGVGRKEKIEFRYVRLDPQEKWIDPLKPLLLRAENQSTFDSGFYRDRIDGVAPERLVMAAKNFGNPVRAKDADVLLLTASRFDEFPDLLATDSTFKELKKVSQVGAQKNQFLWGTSELISYQNLDGVPLTGILIKPENFDPKRKYPMIVYIYERLSQGLHQFVNPSPGTSINRTFYASNDYLVLMPDIVYTVGYPGQSAIKSVLPAVQAVVNQGFVQEDAIGIQGHSWGGYQIAYMVTQTTRFRAAAAGAVVGDMISAYSGIRWGTGLPRQFQYERTQSRIGGSLWEYPLRFIENSPIFHADRVQTPVMMVHNDNDDAVPWTQGIEYYLALRRLGKEAYMFNYNGEYHGLRKRQNQKDYTRRMQEFFDHFLKGAPQPEWMEKGIPFLQREKEKEKYKAASDMR